MAKKRKKRPQGSRLWAECRKGTSFGETAPHLTGKQALEAKIRELQARPGKDLEWKAAVHEVECLKAQLESRADATAKLKSERAGWAAMLDEWERERHQREDALKTCRASQATAEESLMSERRSHFETSTALNRANAQLDAYANVLRAEMTTRHC